MKRFTTFTAVFGISILAVWAIFQLFSASQQQPEHHIAPIALQTAQAEYMNAPDSNKVLVPASDVESRSVAPVFDSNGALVSDPSGALANDTGAIPVTGREMNVAPVFDANGRVVSNPSGTILTTAPSGLVAPVFDASGAVLSDPSGTLLNSKPSNLKGNVAPVYDANGTLVSDPSGTILNANQP